MNVVDVIRVISMALEDKYPNMPVQDRDIDDTSDRPCIIIDVSDISSELEAVGYIKDSFDLEIYVYVEDLNTGFLQLLDLKNELLLWLSNTIQVEDLGYVTPSNVTAEISKVDKALRVTFGIEIFTNFNNDDTSDLEDMENLAYKEG